MSEREKIVAEMVQSIGISPGMAAVALTALEAAGYVVVPKEPTEAMVRAYWKCVEDGLNNADGRYRAMIAAPAQKED